MGTEHDFVPLRRIAQGKTGRQDQLLLLGPSQQRIWSKRELGTAGRVTIQNLEQGPGTHRSPGACEWLT